MAYVSLGRSDKLKDIHIYGKVDTAEIHAAPEAVEETNRLQCMFDERIKNLEERKDKFWKISYLNVPSLKKHKKDVDIDNFILNSDIFSLGETWLEPGVT